MPRLNASNPIVEPNRTMARHYRDYITLLEALAIPLTGEGSPEGVVDAQQYVRYIDRTGGSSLEYIKLQTNIGGDRTKGWVLIGGLGAGISDHGQLSGLSDNDHPQYALSSHTHTEDDIDSESALSGDVLTADGAGGAAFQTPGAGSGTVTSVAVSGSDGIEVDSGSPITTSGTIALGVNATTLRTHINVEDGSTADQTNAEIETAYNAQVGQVSSGEKTAGTETNVRRFSPKDVADMAGTHGVGGTTITALVEEEIETITLSTAGEFDFDLIPSTFDDLLFRGQVTSDRTDTLERDIRIFFNTDLTDTNYNSQRNIGNNGAGSNSEANNSRICLITGGGAPTPTDFEITIPGYAASPWGSRYAHCRFYRLVSSGHGTVGLFGVQSAVTSAIDRVRFREPGHATDGLLGTVTLYGRKKQDIKVF